MGNRQNQLIMLKLHLFPRDSGKDAILGPPKLPLGSALGQFWKPSDGIFSRVPRKKVEFWPIITWAGRYYLVKGGQYISHDQGRIKELYGPRAVS